MRLSPPIILLNADSLDFGEVPVGLFAEKHVTIANGGDQPLELRALSTLDAAAFASFDPLEPIAAGSQKVLTVRFSPSAAAPYEGKLVIESSASNAPTSEVTLKGVGVPATSCGDCNTPPEPRCLTDSHRLVYSATGTCVEDRCQYTASSEVCADGCDAMAGACVGVTAADAGFPDATFPDATFQDATFQDATFQDAEVSRDAGTPDASVQDAELEVDSGLPGPRLTHDVPGEYAFVVPPGISSLHVRAWGGGGQGGNQDGATGGGGGFVEADVQVTPGETLDIWVAEGGGYGQPSSLGNGGGATYVRRGSTDLLIAGGGGGGGSDGNSGNSMSGGAGGAGGGLSGEDGTDGRGAIATFCTGVTRGTGGTPSAGGAGGTSAGTAASRCSGQPGAQNAGGRATGVNGTCDTHPGAQTWHMGGGQSNGGGGGGGSGYFGGGGSGFIWTYCGAGGGGGSSYADPALNGVTHVGGHLEAAGLETQASGAGHGGQRCLGRLGEPGCLDPNGGNGRVELRF